MARHLAELGRLAGATGPFWMHGLFYGAQAHHVSPAERRQISSRVRSRPDDLATLHALSRAVGRGLTIDEPAARTSGNGLWPAMVDRDLESKLVEALSMRTSRPEEWCPLGPPFFLAGLAVTLASVPGFDRRQYLDLAEALHPGATEQRVFAKWLAETPLPPSRFLPMLQARLNREA